MNRQSRCGGDWRDRGAVTFEEAAKLEAADIDKIFGACGRLTIAVRCDTNPADVRIFTVSRKPVEYVVHGLRGRELPETEPLHAGGV